MTQCLPIWKELGHWQWDLISDTIQQQIGGSTSSIAQTREAYNANIDATDQPALRNLIDELRTGAKKSYKLFYNYKEPQGKKALRCETGMRVTNVAWQFSMLELQDADAHISAWQQGWAGFDLENHFEEGLAWLQQHQEMLLQNNTSIFYEKNAQLISLIYNPHTAEHKSALQVHIRSLGSQGSNVPYPGQKAAVVTMEVNNCNLSSIHLAHGILWAVQQNGDSSDAAVSSDCIRQTIHWVLCKLAMLCAHTDNDSLRRRLHGVVLATNILVWEWDLVRNHLVSEAREHPSAFGYSTPVEMDLLSLMRQRVHPEDLDKLSELYKKILHEPGMGSFSIEYRYRADSGVYADILSRGEILRGDVGEAIWVVGVSQNITESRLLQRTLVSKELEKQKMLTQQTIETQEKERREIGKELHDSVNQLLTTTKLYIELCQTDPELRTDLLRKSSQNINTVINEIRQLSRSLMNPSLGDLGLVEAIHDLIGDIHLTRTVQVNFTADEDIDDFLEEKQKVTLYRIVQEAFNNVIRHSGAKDVFIELKKKGDQVLLGIQDDGIGFDVEKMHNGTGISNIQNRIYLADGVYEIVSAPGAGTTIKVQIPLKNQP